MKRRFLFATACILGLLICSCKMNVLQNNAKIQITMPYGHNSRAADDEKVIYSFIVDCFKGSEITDTPYDSQTAESNQTVIFDDLIPGDYTIRVRAYEYNNFDVLLYEGSLTNTVHEGDPTKFNIKLKKVQTKTEEPVEDSEDDIIEVEPEENTISSKMMKHENQVWIEVLSFKNAVKGKVVETSEGAEVQENNFENEPFYIAHVNCANGVTVNKYYWFFCDIFMDSITGDTVTYGDVDKYCKEYSNFYIPTVIVEFSDGTYDSYTMTLYNTNMAMDLAYNQIKQEKEQGKNYSQEEYNKKYYEYICSYFMTACTPKKYISLEDTQKSSIDYTFILPANEEDYIDSTLYLFDIKDLTCENALYKIGGEKTLYKEGDGELFAVSYKAEIPAGIYHATLNTTLYANSKNALQYIISDLIFVEKGYTTTASLTELINVYEEEPVEPKITNCKIIFPESEDVTSYKELYIYLLYDDTDDGCVNIGDYAEVDNVKKNIVYLNDIELQKYNIELQKYNEQFLPVQILVVDKDGEKTPIEDLSFFVSNGTIDGITFDVSNLKINHGSGSSVIGGGTGGISGNKGIIQNAEIYLPYGENVSFYKNIKIELEYNDTTIDVSNMIEKIIDNIIYLETISLPVIPTGPVYVNLYIEDNDSVTTNLTGGTIEFINGISNDNSVDYSSRSINHKNREIGEFIFTISPYFDDYSYNAYICYNNNGSENVVKIEDSYITCKEGAEINTCQLIINDYTIDNKYYNSNVSIGLKVYDEVCCETTQEYSLDFSSSNTINQTLTFPELYHKYTVNWNFTSGFINIEDFPSSYEVGKRELIPTPIKEGYSFEGWHNGNNETVLTIDPGKAENGENPNEYYFDTTLGYEHGQMTITAVPIFVEKNLITSISATPDYTAYETASDRATTYIKYKVEVTYSNTNNIEAAPDLQFIVTKFGLAPFNNGQNSYLGAMQEINQNGNFSNFKYTGGAGYTEKTLANESELFSTISTLLDTTTYPENGYTKTISNNIVTYEFSLAAYKSDTVCTSGDNWIQATGLTFKSVNESSKAAYCCTDKQ